VEFSLLAVLWFENRESTWDSSEVRVAISRRRPMMQIVYKDYACGLLAHVGRCQGGDRASKSVRGSILP